MSTTPPTPPDHDLGRLRTLRDALSNSSRAPSTQTAYRSAWTSFETWTRLHGVQSLPASGDTVALYVAHLVERNRAMSTITRAVTAIAQTHLDHGFPSPRLDPNLRRVIRGARRQLKSSPRAKEALDVRHLSAAIAAQDQSPRSSRDRALLLVGFAAGLRRSEIAALDVADLQFDGQGIVVRIRRSKTDPFSVGRTLRIPATLGDGLMPLEAVQRWIEVGSIREGPLFRCVLRSGRVTKARIGTRTVARIVQAAVARAGLDPSKFSGHSLRRGCATTAAEQGQSAREIASLLGHRTESMATRYIQDRRFPSL